MENLDGFWTHLDGFWMKKLDVYKKRCFLERFFLKKIKLYVNTSRKSLWKIWIYFGLIWMDFGFKSWMYIRKDVFLKVFSLKNQIVCKYK